MTNEMQDHEWKPGFATEQEAFDYALQVRSWGEAKRVDVELNRDNRWSVVIWYY